MELLTTMVVGATLLVHGLRAESDEAPPEAGDGDAEDRLWCRISEALLSRWSKPLPSPGTVRAEQGLGILGSPHYFYVMRAHRTFGYVVFLFEEIETEKVPSDVKGATPFDSGGLWVGAIKPIKGKRAKLDLFANEDVALGCWRSTFLTYMNSNYSNAKDYVDGKPPKFGIEGIAYATSTNEARAWTWEVRYPNGLASSRLRLNRAYMHRDDHTAYLEWLPHSGYEDAEIVKLAKLVGSRIEAHEGEIMASDRAESTLRGLI